MEVGMCLPSWACLKNSTAVAACLQLVGASNEYNKEECALLFEMVDITLMALGAGYGRHPMEKGMVEVKNRKCSWLVLATTHGKVC